MNADRGSTELVYVSWGGTGRATTVRKALQRAEEAGCGLVYLAILDDSAFGDLDAATLELAKDELLWLLDAQLDLTKGQLGAEDLDVRVLIRAGDVADEIVDVADILGETEVLIGAPIPEANRGALEALISVVSARSGARVVLLEP